MMSLIKRLPKRSIIDPCSPGSEPMMVRYFLVRTRFIGVYLHRWLRSDHDRAAHDHPWDFLTFLLSSGYWEHTPHGASWRRRFTLHWRPAEWRHWVEIPRPLWTLVVRFRRRREWGFHTDHGWVQWQAYDAERCSE